MYHLKIADPSYGWEEGKTNCLFKRIQKRGEEGVAFSRSTVLFFEDVPANCAKGVFNGELGFQSLKEPHAVNDATD